MLRRAVARADRIFPREIITVQAGQCGNSSQSNLRFTLLTTVSQRIHTDVVQLAASSGNSSVRSMALEKMATSRTLRLKAATEKTSSSTRVTTPDTFQERS